MVLFSSSDTHEDPRNRRTPSRELKKLRRLQSSKKMFRPAVAADMTCHTAPGYSSEPQRLAMSEGYLGEDESRRFATVSRISGWKQSSNWKVFGELLHISGDRWEK